MIFEDIVVKFCTHIYQSLPSDILNVFFENFDFQGGNFEKKCLKAWKFFDILNILKIRDSNFVALLILRHVI